MSRHTLSRMDRVAQMSIQEEVIAKKKLEIMEKQKTAELAKQVVAAQIGNNSKLKKEKTLVKTSVADVLLSTPKNNFSNDGSFFENFKKITDAAKKAQQETTELLKLSLNEKSTTDTDEASTDNSSRINDLVESFISELHPDAAALCAKPPPPPPPPPLPDEDPINSPLSLDTFATRSTVFEKDPIPEYKLIPPLMPPNALFQVSPFSSISKVNVEVSSNQSMQNSSSPLLDVDLRQPAASKQSSNCHLTDFSRQSQSNDIPDIVNCEDNSMNIKFSNPISSSKLTVEQNIYPPEHVIQGNPFADDKMSASARTNDSQHKHQATIVGLNELCIPNQQIINPYLSKPVASGNFRNSVGTTNFANSSAPNKNLRDQSSEHRQSYNPPTRSAQSQNTYFEGRDDFSSPKNVSNMQTYTNSFFPNNTISNRLHNTQPNRFPAHNNDANCKVSFSESFPANQFDRLNSSNSLQGANVSTHFNFQPEMPFNSNQCEMNTGSQNMSTGAQNKNALTSVPPPSLFSLYPPLHTIPPPKPLSLSKIPAPRELDLDAIPEPTLNVEKIKIPDNSISRVFSDHEFIPTSIESLVELVAENGDEYEDKLRSRKIDMHSSLWFLCEKGSLAYRNYRQKVLELRHNTTNVLNNLDIYDPAEVYNDYRDDDDDKDNYDSDSQYLSEKKERNLINMKSNLNRRKSSYNSSDSDDNENTRKPVKRLCDIDDRIPIQNSPISHGNKKKRSRWGDKIDAPVAPRPLMSLSLPHSIVNKPSLKSVTRTDPALLQYARQNYGSTNLSEEEWAKCMDHYKINLLYQDMLKKRNEIDRLTNSGRFKYEYDSDEDVNGGTWEHKLRNAEMEATAVWSEALNKQAEGKHHIGDFLPPEELKKFLEKYDSQQNSREPDISDYREYKLNESNKGFQMLQKLGWKEGQGLGNSGSGILDPVNKAPQRENNQGLGSGTNSGPEFGDNEYDAYRKRMMLAYRFRPNPLNNPRRAYY